MKKILISILCIASFLPSVVYAKYTLSSNQTKKVERAITAINTFIDKKGEKYREILLKKISQILARPLSEKNIAIFTMLEDGIAQSNETSVSKEEIIISEKDVSFVFETTANRCSENPCTTTENFVKIKGNVSNLDIAFIEVNDYRLKSYQGSNWEYNPNIAYGNFQDGKNTYVIHYKDINNQVLYTQNFIVYKNAVVENTPEVTDKVTNNTSDNNTSATSYTNIGSSGIPHVDEDAVRKYWLGLINGERKLLGLNAYTYDPTLDTSAKIWSNLALERGYIDHKVDSPSDSYYDYWKKVKWMENNGVICKNISRATFSESIAWQQYYCKNTSTCTDQMKKAVKRSFDFYMSEKGTTNDPHYRAIAHQLFTTMGLGLSIENLGNGNYKMYLTNHYCTTNIKQ